MRILLISSFYPGNLKYFYDRHPDHYNLSYNELLEKILSDTTEFGGAYFRTFKRLGYDVGCIIGNDLILRERWINENQIKLTGNEIIQRQIAAFKPEVIFVDDINLIDSVTLKSIKSKVASIRIIAAYHCSPYNQKLMDQLKDVDVAFTCVPGIRDDFINSGLKTFLVYHGFDTEILNRLETERKPAINNLVFSGSLSTGGGYHGERLKLIEKMLDENLDIGLYVNLESKARVIGKKLIYSVSDLLSRLNIQDLEKKFTFLKHSKTPVSYYSRKLLSKSHPPVYGLKMYELFRSSGIVLNYHIGASGSYAGNMRMFEVTGAGGCLLTDKKKNLNDLFEDGKEIVAYENADDCIEKAKWLLSNEKQRKEIAVQGQLRTLRSHSVENRCLMIIEALTKEIKMR